MDFFLHSFQVFLIVFMRVSAIFFIAPVISSNVLLVRYRLVLAFFIVLCVFPWLSTYLKDLPESMFLYFIILVKEFLLGAMIGFFILLIFTSFQLSTQFFSTQVGFGMSQIIDPLTQEETPLFGYFFNTAVMLMFLIIGGVHLVIKVVVDSYKLIPAVDMIGNGELIMNEAIKYFGIMFTLALKIALPVIVSSLIVVVALGLIGKAAPQANIMILGLPIHLMVGLIMVIAILPFVVGFFEGAFFSTINDIMKLFEGFKKI